MKLVESTLNCVKYTLRRYISSTYGSILVGMFNDTIKKMLALCPLANDIDTSSINIFFTNDLSAFENLCPECEKKLIICCNIILADTTTSFDIENFCIEHLKLFCSKIICQVYDELLVNGDKYVSEISRLNQSINKKVYSHKTSCSEMIKIISDYIENKNFDKASLKKFIRVIYIINIKKSARRIMHSILSDGDQYVTITSPDRSKYYREGCDSCITF